MEPTSEEGVFIEERRDGYVRYVRDDGTRWEIHGTCDYRGDCLIGSVLPDGTVIDSRETLDRLSTERGRLVSALDVPVTPEFTGCCPLTGRWL